MTAAIKHNATMDGLRGIAAFCVVWGHLTAKALPQRIPFHGYLAVDFFFVLSGFVVASAYENKLRAKMSLATFIKVRLIRLYPLLVLGTILGLASKLFGFYSTSSGALHLHSAVPLYMAVLFGLLLIPFPWVDGVSGNMAPLDDPLWSLMLEIWINIFYAATIRYAMRVALIVAPVSALAILYFCATLGGLDHGFSLGELDVGLARIGFSFFAGVIVQKLLTPARLAVVPAISAPMLMVGLILIMAAGPWFGGWYDAVAVLVFFPAIVALAAKDAIGPFWRPSALWLGALSYPVYVLHSPTITHFTHLGRFPQIEKIGAMVAAFGFMLVFSAVVLRFYDEPIRRRLSGNVRKDYGKMGEIPVLPMN